MINKNIIGLFKKTKVFLIGDIMLDRYVFGKVNRISPEGPVPIFLANNMKDMLGGSGNVLSNLVSLGTDAFYLSLIGNDNNGVRIKKLLKKLNFKNYKLILDPTRKTTVKTRYISNSQQIIRIDEENTENIVGKIENELIRKIDTFIKKKDVVIISDYNKGVITKRVSEYIIKKANSLKIPVIIDPKKKDFNIYKNATLITPNQLEASEVTQMKLKNNIDTDACGKLIIKKYNIDRVLITRGEKGLSLISKKSSIHSPTTSKEVFDVSGAGDTVLAVIASCLTNKIEEKKILDLANKAAGKVIAKIGTSTISIEELIGDNLNLQKNKILDIKSLCQQIKKDKNKGLKIGFTNGCFDILHYGHIHCIEKSKQNCDKLIVALNSNKSVKLLKGKNRPINDELYRAMVLASLQSCDYVTIFNEKTPLKTIMKIKPDLITKGGDYKNKKIVGESEIKKWGGKVIKLKFVEGLSSSKLISKLEK
tara:strand:+ start:214 stop:1650 length:1437 start_codon:yes stop_codon:yes gene_type:complete